MIELVSPKNLAHPESRQAFTAKTFTYLQQGIGVVLIDIITESSFNLHNELIDLMRLDEPRMNENDNLYVASYRPFRRTDNNGIDVWLFPLALGEPLPTVPLGLKRSSLIPVDLELTYEEAREASQIDPQT